MAQMEIIAAIAQEAGIPVYDSMELIAKKDMPKFLEVIRNNSEYYILGLDGFRIFENKIIPDMGAIADFSILAETRDCEKSIEATYYFLSQVTEEDLFFYVTLDDVKSGSK